MYGNLIKYFQIVTMTSDLEKCKKYLRSILLASKGGVPGVQLVSKYRENTGDSIPYRSFGFSSLETFLQSIPEVCRIVTRGREVMVEGVATKETKHIKELVQNQGGSDRDRSRRRGGGGGYEGGNRGGGYLYPNYSRLSVSRMAAAYKPVVQPPPKQAKQPTTVPVKREAVSVIVVRPKKVFHPPPSKIISRKTVNNNNNNMGEKIKSNEAREFKTRNKNAD